MPGTCQTCTELPGPVEQPCRCCPPFPGLFWQPGLILPAPAGNLADYSRGCPELSAAFPKPCRLRPGLLGAVRNCPGPLAGLPAVAGAGRNYWSFFLPLRRNFRCPFCSLAGCAVAPAGRSIPSAFCSLALFTPWPIVAGAARSFPGLLGSCATSAAAACAASELLAASRESRMHAYLLRILRASQCRITGVAKRKRDKSNK